LTIFAGSTISFFLPLLIFNTLMGFIYITTGFIILRNIGQKANAELKKTVLELGSNDAHMVFENANIDLTKKRWVLS